MFSLRSIVVTVAVLVASPLSLAAPSIGAKGSLVQHEQRDDLGSNVASLEQRASEGVLEELQGRAAAAGCYVTSKKGKDCHASQCPASEQCKVNDKGNCVYKNKKKDRPFGCEQCSCKKAS